MVQLKTVSIVVHGKPHTLVGSGFGTCTLADLAQTLWQDERIPRNFLGLIRISSLFSELKQAERMSKIVLFAHVSRRRFVLRSLLKQLWRYGRNMKRWAKHFPREKKYRTVSLLQTEHLRHHRLWQQS